MTIGKTNPFVVRNGKKDHHAIIATAHKGIIVVAIVAAIVEGRVATIVGVIVAVRSATLRKVTDRRTCCISSP